MEDEIKIVKDTLANIERIQNYKNHPGKFEGETLATNYYYDLSLDGGQTVFEVTSAEKLLFGIEDRFVAVLEDNNGFVTLETSDNESTLESLFDLEDEDEFESDEEEDE